MSRIKRQLFKHLEKKGTPNKEQLSRSSKSHVEGTAQVNIQRCLKIKDMLV